MNDFEKLIAEMEDILAKDSSIDALVKRDIQGKIDELKNSSKDNKKSRRELVKEGLEIFSLILGLVTNLASLLTSF